MLLDLAHPEPVRNGDVEGVAPPKVGCELGHDGFGVMCAIDIAEIDIDKEFTRLRALKVCAEATEEGGYAPAPVIVEDDVGPDSGCGEHEVAPVAGDEA